MKRRDFLKSSIAATGGAVLFGAAGVSGSAETIIESPSHSPGDSARGGWYLGNRAPLAPSKFMKLPIGNIVPRGWLRHQLELQAEGLCGRMPEVSDYLVYEGNGWVTPGSNVGWEEVPYWLRGFGDTGYVLGDTRIIALATQWIDGVISSQQPDGWFGPKSARTSLDGGPDLWPHMPVLEALRSFYEYKKDPRVITFMTNYFQYQTTVPKTQFIKSWAGVRWGNNLDSIIWLYNRTGDAKLLDLATTIHNNSADYVNTIPTWHNVNLSQGFREPAEYGLIAKEAKYLAASERVYDTFMDKYGQFPGGGFAGDENCRVGYHDPRQGFETCGIVELMQSFEIMTLISANPKWSDRTEELAFNMMPAAFDPLQKGTHYITSMNSIELDNIGKQHSQYGNGAFPMQAYKPGVHDYRCCPHNYGMGWPYYAEHMWLGTADNGLCASLYAESEVKAKVGNGTVVHIATTTDYPFSDTINFALTSPSSVEFPLYLRVPGWCANPSVKVNGKLVTAEGGPDSYLIVRRLWKTGDKISLHLPMTTSVKTWAKNKNAVSMHHGPLNFSLALAEDWNRYAGTERWPEWEVHTKSSWNYGLMVDAHSHAFNMIRKPGALAPNPFTYATNPMEIHVKAKKIPAWTPDVDGVVSTLQQSPVRSDQPVETVALVPMGTARLRITTFPHIGDGPDATDWVAPDRSVVFSASIMHDNDMAYNDAGSASKSSDQSVPRFTWWDHKGTEDWAQYDFGKPHEISSADVYWFDDTGVGQCRVPASWKLQYWDGAAWNDVLHPTSFDTTADKLNHVSFDKISTNKLRLAVQLQPNYSGGLLAFKVQ